MADIPESVANPFCRVHVQQSQGHDGPKLMIQEVEYQNSILCSGFGRSWNSTI